MNPVACVERSENVKMGDCSATYVSQASCPSSCPLYGAGCYAELGYAGLTTARLNGSPVKRADDLARLEAAAIDGLSGRRPLRLHVVVDCRTNTAARIVGEASRRYKEKYGSKVWSYTHAWRVVDRKSWGDAVSVLASCEKPSDIPTAMSRGYAVAIVVTEFPSTKAFDVVAGIKAIPCPAQTRHKTCSECRLCLDADRLLGSKLAIAFEPHGSKAGAVRKTLVALDTI